MTPKFAVGEVCLLQSRNSPHLNGECTVLEIVKPGEWIDEEGVPKLWPEEFGVCYLLTIATEGKSPYWSESALRKKHDPSQYKFDELMDNLKNMATA